MKKFLKKILPFALFCLLVTTLIPVCVDPYNVFHVNQVRDNGIEPNKNYIKMSYILENPDKFDSFMFGSSRVGAIHVEKIENERCYNMTYSVGVPAEHLENIRTLVKNGIIPDKIYIGVDSLSYTSDAKLHESEPIRASYEHLTTDRLAFAELYLNVRMVLDSLKITASYNGTNDALNAFYDYGWIFDYGTACKPEYFEQPEASIGTEDCMDETLEDMASIVEICKENDIELIVFTNPMYEVTYEASAAADYEIFLHELAEITDFYNFSGLNSITLDKENYIDTSHYKPEIGDMMIQCMEGEQVDPSLYEQGFGWYVTNQNVDELEEILFGANSRP